MNIMIVDDEMFMIEVLSRGLRIKGFNVIEALSGMEALKHFNRGKPKIDMVIADYAMAGMDGLELLNAIRENDGSLPVILMTGYPCSELASEALRSGCDSLIEKPFTLNHLIDEIHRIRRLSIEKGLRDARKEKDPDC